jgi:hypothetical protein
MVRLCKTALKHAIGDHVLSALELQTVLFEVAILLNERPIGKSSSDPDDGAYICPNDILLGRASNTVPQGPFRESNIPRHRVEFCQKMLDSFWNRWYRDVFPSLIVPRRKWQTAKRNVCVDDYVLVMDTNPIRGHWKTGRVTNVFKGSDNRVRNAKVKTAKNEYERPITKMVECILSRDGEMTTSSSAGRVFRGFIAKSREIDCLNLAPHYFGSRQFTSYFMIVGFG